MDCNKNCGSCGGCGKVLELSQQELAMLERFGQVAFLPVARSHDGETPIYLEESDVEERIKKINENMEEYLNNDLFTEYTDSMIYLERTQNDGKV